MKNDWNAEDTYWKSNYKSRPYASAAGREYDYYRPGYRYGYESASRYQDRQWDDVESELERDYAKYEHRGQTTWEQIKDAVRDAWNRVTGHTPVSTR